MATYAAFKHVELHKVGYGKNRVPNAPRGCIGEIFGDSPQGNSKSGGNCPDTPSRPRDTHSRLFGAAPPANGPVRDNLRSSIPIGQGEKRPGSSSSNGSNGSHHGYAENGQSNGNGHHMHSNGQTNGHSVSPAKETPNGISVEHKSMNGEINTSVTALNPTTILHNKVPPGGFSSGLW